MKERPIIFNDEMVRALLAGRKTQTRRVVKPQPDSLCDKVLREVLGHDVWWKFRYSFNKKCPYGVPGDRLWVREVFTLESSQEVSYDPPHKDGRPILHVDGGVDCGTWWEQPHYRATDPEPELVVEGRDGPGCRWSSPFYLPRWASRILLEVTGVQVERVQEITEKDAVAEGVDIGVLSDAIVWKAEDRNFKDALSAFRFLWDSINKDKPGRSWAENPWVWAITFKVIQ